MMENWLAVWKSKEFRIKFFTTIFILIAALFSLAQFLQFNETRLGATIDDPVLNLFSPIDVTWITFSLIYVSIIIGLVHLSADPVNLLSALQAYIVMILFRIIIMYSLPLEPPVSMIALKDPFVEFFGTGKVLMKDLFFSGHTSTIFLLFLVSGSKKYKMLFLIAAVFVGISVLVQHVHYTVDVLAAPFVSYASYRLVKFINKSK